MRRKQRLCAPSYSGGLEINEIKRENRQLREQLAATNQQIDANNELVEYVERERSLSERRASAGILQKTKWALFGMDVDGTDRDD